MKVQSRNVLLVDDREEYCKQFCAEALRRGRYSVKYECQGSRVRQLVTNAYPDVLVIDWQLSKDQVSPDFRTRDGVLVGLDIRASRPSLPIIVLTVHDQEDIREETQGVFHCIGKDAKWDEIFGLIDRV